MYQFKLELLSRSSYLHNSHLRFHIRSVRKPDDR